MTFPKDGESEELQTRMAIHLSRCHWENPSVLEHWVEINTTRGTFRAKVWQARDHHSSVHRAYKVRPRSLRGTSGALQRVLRGKPWLCRDLSDGDYYFTTSTLFTTMISTSTLFTTEWLEKWDFSYSFSFFSSIFLQLHLQLMEVPRLRVCRVRATAAGLHHSHSNLGSKPHRWPMLQLAWATLAP